jgi:hypothetical protein
MHGLHDIDTDWKETDLPRTRVDPSNCHTNNLLAVSISWRTSHIQPCFDELVRNSRSSFCFEQLVGSSRSSDQQHPDKESLQIMPFTDVGRLSLTHGCTECSNIRNLYLNLLLLGKLLFN